MVLIVIPVAFALKEPKRYKEIFEQNYLKEIWEILKNVIWKNRRLRWLILYSALVFAFNQSALWLYQPYFKLSGLDIAYFGIVFASFQIVAAISARYAHQIEEKLGEKFSFVSLLFLIGVSYLLMSNFIFLFSFSFAFIHQFIRSFKNVVIIDYINRETQSSIRATVLSIENFVRRGLYALLIPIVGWIADAYSLAQALTVLGITSLIIAVLLIIVLRKYKVI
jgi:predicted DNA-binding transcriptional regulator